MSDYKHRRFLLVTDAQREKANASARDIDPDPACGETFIVPLSPSGKLPATHWLSQMPLTDELLDRAGETFKDDVMSDAKAGTEAEFLKAQGLQRIEPVD